MGVLLSVARTRRWVSAGFPLPGVRGLWGTEASSIPLIRGEAASPERPKAQKTAVTGVPVLYLLSASPILGSSIFMRCIVRKFLWPRQYLS
jgi:hypothetical protein